MEEKRSYSSVMGFLSPERIANTNERSAETPFDSMLDKPLSHPLLSTTGGAMADCRAVPTLLPRVPGSSRIYYHGRWRRNCRETITAFSCLRQAATETLPSPGSARPGH